MTTLDQDHAMMVAALIKPGEEIIAETTPLKAHLNHMAMLLSGEAGEVVDAIKKHTIYNKELDFVNVIEELGDIEFALEAIRKSLGIHRDETLAMNMEKLSKRYPQGSFSNTDAQTRADKAPVQEALGLDDSGIVYPPNTTEGIFLQYRNGELWTSAGGPYPSEHVAWFSLGRDCNDYRTVMNGKVLTDKS
jgi:NTP pyrophosphatase (non-canonical NTP hydrolase)